jgi:hypothetical protein
MEREPLGQNMIQFGHGSVLYKDVEQGIRNAINANDESFLPFFRKPFHGHAL